MRPQIFVSQSKKGSFPKLGGKGAKSKFYSTK